MSVLVSKFTSVYCLSRNEKIIITFLFVFAMSSPQDKTREKVLHNYVQNTSHTMIKLAKDCNVPLTTTHRIIKKYLLTCSITRKIGTGRKVFSGNKKLALQVVRSIQRNPLLSLRDLAKKFGTSKSSIKSNQE